MKKIAIVLLAAMICALSAGAFAEADKPLAGTEITVYNCFDYIDTQVLDIFEEETGIHVNYVNYTDNEALYTRVSTGAGSYDVIVPSEYMIMRLIKEDLLAELDLSNIPNLENVLPSLRDPAYDPGNAHSIPYMWGTLGILYNTGMVEEPITSWNALLDERYSGSIYMMDSVRDSMGLALKALGYSMITRDENELAEAGDWLMAQKDAGLVAGYILDQAKDKMVANEAAMAVVYSGDAQYAIEKNDKLANVIPEEGSNVWVDGMCVPKNAPNKAGAECFINFMCRPDIAQMNWDEIRYSSPIIQVVEGMSEEDLASCAMNPTEEMLARCEYYDDYTDIAWMYDDIWMDVLM